MSPKGVPGSLSPHGTLTRYYSQGCRCPKCQAARREYDGTQQTQAEYFAERRKRADATHGVEWAYVRGCRCAACREASRAARAERRARASA